MATTFNSQIGDGKYRLQFETDSKEHYLAMQEMARRCVDGRTMEWISVEERLPEKMQNVLMLNKEGSNTMLIRGGMTGQDGQDVARGDTTMSPTGCRFRRRQRMRKIYEAD